MFEFEENLIRPVQVQELLHCSKTVLYDWVDEGLLTPPFKIGKRATAWPTDELKRILAARIAGASELEIKVLVAKMLIERKAQYKSEA